MTLLPFAPPVLCRPSRQRTSDLGRLFHLAARVNGLEAVRAAWREYIQASGSAIVKDEEKVRGQGAGGRRLGLEGLWVAALAGLGLELGRARLA